MDTLGQSYSIDSVNSQWIQPRATNSSCISSKSKYGKWDPNL